MKKTTLFLALLGLISFAGNAQNILSTSSWAVGSGSVSNFSQNGATAENIREWGDGPFGRTILWKGVPDATTDADGGFNTTYYPIDNTKMYRLSIWLKKTGSLSGNSYLGTSSGNVPLTTLTGTENTNPYFFSADLPQLDRWYLVVGYIHSKDDPSTVTLSAVYDGVTGEKVAVSSLRDFKFQTGTTSIRLRSYAYYITDSNDRQYFYGPRMEEVNGEEPTIQAMLGLGVQNAIDGNALYPSKIGINTTSASMGNYELAVNGEIRAKEVKVETGWADFVFEEDYQLMDLMDLKSYVKQNKHLPEIPSAVEVAAEGVSLGEMDKLLLQKIEELTLYVIQQQEQIKEQQKQIKEQQERIKVLEAKQ